ncbi:aldo/keto reductase [Bacteroides graminisolvens]|uniref:aldo/keto reductase n=1 Tax=Bacteroides graminisolvens TaxID=477666 RepID=UPI0023F2E407|nr:aldo/keto reductase [Bacteroides graminisolvens]MDD3211732.1 aldo/keto reductase [Bacteroides graminisolvens]
MKEQDKNKINRRHFLKMMGVGAAAGTTLLYGCHSDNKQSSKSSAQLPVPTDKMTYRINPSTGDRVSLLGYGCMRWPTMPSPDGKGEIIDQEQVNRLVDYAIAHGVNFFDTSPVYVQGLSEKATGIALKRHPRNKYFISTKLSNFQNYSRENSIAMYQQSFKDLQTDYIDYYLLHAVGGGGISALKERYFDNGLLDFLLNERKAGRIRNLGFSFHGEVEVYDYLLASDIKWDFVLIQLNYVDWKHASGFNVNADYLYGELVKKGIRALVMEPLLGGRLTKLSDSLVARLKERRPEASVASWAFRFSGSPENVLSVLSGMTYMEHLQDNIRTYSPLEPLTDEEKDFLEETAQILLKYPTIPCTDCKYCMPCPYGIDIPTIFMHYNKCVNEGNVPKSQQDPIYREARTAFLVGYDRTVPRLRQASHCIGCEICKPHCPQNIEIPEELHRIDAFVEQLKQNTL